MRPSFASRVRTRANSHFAAAVRSEALYSTVVGASPSRTTIIDQLLATASTLSAASDAEPGGDVPVEGSKPVEDGAQRTARLSATIRQPLSVGTVM